MAAGPGYSWAEGAGGGRGARGPALSHPGRFGPGRAAAPVAGTGRPGPDYALGKSPIHGARPFPSATGLGPRSRAGWRPRVAGRANLASPRAATPAGRPDPCPLSLAPSGSLLPRASLAPDSFSQVKYWARALKEPRSRALCFPVPCPRLPGSSPALLRLCGALLLGNSRPFALFSWGSGPGRRAGMPVRRPDGAPRRRPSARESGPACSAALARPRSRARRERALTPQVTRATATARVQGSPRAPLPPPGCAVGRVLVRGETIGEHFLRLILQSSGFSPFNELSAKNRILFSDWIPVVAHSSQLGLVVRVQMGNCS
nr:collagen alpha-1(I) chain-like [Globicephala melas]